MKQTAVEWYNSKVIELMTQREQGNIDVLEFRNQLDLLLKQVKAMEKEQHQETFKQSRQAKIFEKDMPPVWESWEQYYNETFKSE